VARLYVVATPIGNLKDITLRALEVLSSVHAVAAEDTRTTRKLLSAHGISKQLLSCHAHSEEQSAKGIIGLLADGHDVAYASDAGTPGVSDPGKLLVRAVRDAGFEVFPIPGASAATALLSVSGHEGKSFFFEGFLSPKSGRRRKRLAELLTIDAAFLLFESPFRVLKLLEDLADLCHDRRIVIGREMTKMHEEYLSGTATELIETLSSRGVQRGEFALLVESGKND
jgi:16S rRNA (cytidine1402-2'-O)-methyltransferase